MRKDIRLAGVSLGWSDKYAQSYGRKLKEMGFNIRISRHELSYIIVYSHKEFTVKEMEDTLDILLEKKE